MAITLPVQRLTVKSPNSDHYGVRARADLPAPALSCRRGHTKRTTHRLFGYPPKGPQAVGQAHRHRLRNRQMGIKPTADELERDRRATLNDQEKSLSIPIEAILGVPVGKLGFRPHARLGLAMQPRGVLRRWQKVIIKQYQQDGVRREGRGWRPTRAPPS